MYVGKIETGKSYKKIIVFFLLISIILIGFVIYASFSKAVINITPTKEVISLEYETKIESNKDIDLAQLQNINGRILQSEIEETVTYDKIELKTVDDFAKGKVTIINNLDHAQPLLPNSQLMSESGVLFRTDERINVPAHGKVEVGVTADQKGATGNVEPTRFTIVKIWSQWQDSLYGQSSEIMTGGTVEAQMATQEVLDQAKAYIHQELFKKAVERMSADLSSNEQITEKATKVEELESEFSVKPDTKTDKFDVKLKLKITAAVFNERTLIDLGIAKMKRDLSESKEFISYDPDKTNYEILEYNIDESWARVKVYLEANVISKLGNDAFNKDKLTGRSMEEVARYYGSMNDIEDVKVYFSPFWVKNVPSLKDHIEIVVQK